MGGERGGGEYVEWGEKQERWEGQVPFGLASMEEKQEQDCFNSHCNISSRGQVKVCTQCNLVVVVVVVKKPKDQPNPTCQFQPIKCGKA